MSSDLSKNILGTLSRPNDLRWIANVLICPSCEVSMERVVLNDPYTVSVLDPNCDGLEDVSNINVGCCMLKFDPSHRWNVKGP